MIRGRSSTATTTLCLCIAVLMALPHSAAASGIWSTAGADRKSTVTGFSSPSLQLGCCGRAVMH